MNILYNFLLAGRFDLHNKAGYMKILMLLAFVNNKSTKCVEVNHAFFWVIFKAIRPHILWHTYTYFFLGQPVQSYIIQYNSVIPLQLYYNIPLLLALSKMCKNQLHIYLWVKVTGQCCTGLRVYWVMFIVFWLFPFTEEDRRNTSGYNVAQNHH